MNTNEMTAPQARMADLVGASVIILAGIAAILMTMLIDSQPASAPSGAGVMDLFSAAQAAPTPTPGDGWFAEGPLRVEVGADGNRWIVLEAGTWARCDSLNSGRIIYNSVKGTPVPAIVAAWSEAERVTVMTACNGQGG